MLIIEGDYGTEERRIQLRKEGAVRGRSERKTQATGFVTDGMSCPERNLLLTNWRRQ